MMRSQLRPPPDRWKQNTEGEGKRPPRCARRILTGCARLHSGLEVVCQLHVSPVESVAHPTNFKRYNVEATSLGRYHVSFSESRRRTCQNTQTYSSLTHSRFTQGMSPDVIRREEEKSLQHGAAVSYCGKRRSQTEHRPNKPDGSAGYCVPPPGWESPQERTDAEICSRAKMITKNAG